jgi:hypothetical protein
MTRMTAIRMMDDRSIDRSGDAGLLLFFLVAFKNVSIRQDDSFDLAPRACLLSKDLVVCFAVLYFVPRV